MSEIKYTLDNGIATVKFNRPEKLNALTLQMYRELGEIFLEIANDERVAVCVLTGEGEKAFCVGADLNESIPFLNEGHYIDEWDYAHLKHVKMNKPIISAINGICMGGGFEIMVATDIRIASEKAVFALPEVSLGIVPAGGTLARLSRQIPYVKMMELILTGNKFNAKQLLDFGVLNYVVPPEELMTKTMSIAERFLELSTIAVQTAKEAILTLSDIPLEEAFRMEALLGHKAFTSEDAKEGLNSFYNKRQPLFPSSKW